jgi:hypothetical protein
MTEPLSQLARDRRQGEFSFREHLELVRLRPGMYGLDGTYHDFVTYLLGYDAGTRDTALLGFREWLVLRLGSGTNLVWPALVAHLSLPDHTADYRSFGHEENVAATAALFGLLSEFLEDRDVARDGLRCIYSDFSARFGH